MKRRKLAIEIVAAGAFVLIPGTLALGQSWQFQHRPSIEYAVPTIPSYQYADQGLRFGLDSVEQRITSRLPAGWPTQWSGPAVQLNGGAVRAGSTGQFPSATTHQAQIINKAKVNSTTDGAINATGQAPATSGLARSLMVRDPFSGRMVPTAAATRWDNATEAVKNRAAQVAQADKSTTANEKAQSGVSSRASVQQSDASRRLLENSSRNAKSSSSTFPSRSSVANSGKPWSVLPSQTGSGSGSAIGGGSGGGIGGGGGGTNGGMGGGTGGGASGGGSSWNPQSGGSSGSSGGFGGGSKTSGSGTLGFADTRTRGGSDGDDPNDDPNDGPNDGPTGDPTGDPTDGPNNGPNDTPNDGPNDGPNDDPNDGPSDGPSDGPNDGPNDGPTDDPTGDPTDGPNDGPTDDPNDDPNDGPNDGANDGPNDGPTDDPNDGGITEIPLPDPEIPDITPDIPLCGDPGHGGGGLIPGSGGGDSPIVPEPGSLILFGIAGGVGAGGLIRRWLKKAKSVATA